MKARDELHRIGRDPALAGVPYIIMINKCDVEDKVPLEEITKKLDIELLQKDRVVHHQQCSALTGEGIWEGLSFLVDLFDKQNKLSEGGTAGGGSTANPSSRVTSGDRENLP